MTMNLSLDRIIRDVDRVLEGGPRRPAGPDLWSFLITELYLERLRPREGRTRWQGAVRGRAVDLASRLARGPLAQTVRVERSFAGTPPGARHLFVFGFPWADLRTTGVLRRLLAELPDAAVGVTDQEDVFDALRAEGIPSLRLRAPRVLHRREVPALGIGPRDRRIMARGAALLEVAGRLLEELRPVSVLTAQDFFPFDQAFARAARQRGIPTVTHQHGQIPAGPTSLYKYLFSERMAVWGRRSAALMEQYVDPARVWVVGTDRFDGLCADRAPAERDSLVLGLNPVEEAGNRALLDQVDAALLGEGRGSLSALVPVLKLHPSLDPARWRGHVAAGRGVPWQVWTGSNEDLLSRTRFLLARRSTITLDAAIAGASVIELGAAQALGAVPGFFEDLPESVMEAVDVGVALTRRLDDPGLEAALLEHQRESLALEVEPGAASAREAAALRTLPGAAL
ncbi:MAG: hypothetical protein ABIK09_10370 [Pseudomonadota bacterium]